MLIISVCSDSTDSCSDSPRAKWFVGVESRVLGRDPAFGFDPRVFVRLPGLVVLLVESVLVGLASLLDGFPEVGLPSLMGGLRVLVDG